MGAVLILKLQHGAVVRGPIHADICVLGRSKGGGTSKKWLGDVEKSGEQKYESEKMFHGRASSMLLNPL